MQPSPIAGPMPAPSACSPSSRHPCLRACPLFFLPCLSQSAFSILSAPPPSILALCIPSSLTPLLPFLPPSPFCTPVLAWCHAPAIAATPLAPLTANLLPWLLPLPPSLAFSTLSRPVTPPNCHSSLSVARLCAVLPFISRFPSPSTLPCHANQQPCPSGFASLKKP